ncbi:MAG: hypothetical protein N2V77_00390 [Canidatus Methanoxibalbensis ujae]|nr:hypothetical protein [Candidatus Methanoxibalbensis ujae]MCW7078465.1 hypothetical protein [Candidatus Methanoxibalbensis ujae]RLG39205.1 MAG: hypothetical protein DRN79_00350 [Methanosarcinales archaeon]
MNEYLELLIGIVLAVIGAFGIYYFLGDVITVLKGVIGIIVLLVGALFLMIGVSDIRSRREEMGAAEVEPSEEGSSEPGR